MEMIIQSNDLLGGKGRIFLLHPQVIPPIGYGNWQSMYRQYKQRIQDMP